MSTPALQQVPTRSDIQQAQLVGLMELERCRRSPLYWTERYCWTQDEKDHERPFKPLIGGERPSLRLSHDLDFPIGFRHFQHPRHGRLLPRPLH